MTNIGEEITRVIENGEDTFTIEKKRDGRTDTGIDTTYRDILRIRTGKGNQLRSRSAEKDFDLRKTKTER